MNFFLEKEDEHKIQVFSCLENTHQQTSTITSLKNELGLSEFLVSKAVNGLVADIFLFNLENYFQIEIVDKQVTLKNLGKATVHFLLFNYIQKSHMFRYFNACANQEVTSVENFAETNFLSISKTYALKNELQLFLKKKNISINQDFQFDGDEAFIRSFFYEIYFYYFNGLGFPFNEELFSLIDSFCTEINAHFQNRITNISLLKLRYFLATIFQRLHTGNTLSRTFNEEITMNKDLPLINLLQHLIEEHTSLKPENILSESVYIASYLYAENILDTEETVLFQKYMSLEIREKTSYLTGYFIKKISMYLQKDISDETIKQLKLELNRIHFKHLYFNFSDFNNSSVLNTSFLKENYLDLYQFTHNFMEEVYGVNVSFSYGNLAPSLFSDYIFVLSAYFPSSHFTDPIYICVDFSQGTLYNKFIVKNIESFKSLNISMESILSSKTDIYISDVQVPNIHCDSLLWNTPPLASDWEVLGNMITHLKLKKQ